MNDDLSLRVCIREDEFPYLFAYIAGERNQMRRTKKLLSMAEHGLQNCSAPTPPSYIVHTHSRLMQPIPVVQAKKNQISKDRLIEVDISHLCGEVD